MVVVYEERCLRDQNVQTQMRNIWGDQQKGLSPYQTK